MPNPAPTNLNGTNPIGLDIDLTWIEPSSTPAPILLLHFDGTNGQTTTTDSSPAANTVTLNTGVVLSTSSPKFGTASLSVPGSSFPSTYVCEIPITSGGPLDIFATAAWTIECFVLIPMYTNTAPVTIVTWGDEPGISTGANILVAPVLNSDGATATFRAVNNSAFAGTFGALITGTIPFVAGTWYHVALVGDSSGVSAYWDGMQVGGVEPSWVAANYTTQSGLVVNIGGEGAYGGGFAAQIDEFRTSNYAVYTANFTPPTAPFSNGGSTVLGYDVYRNGLSIATFLGPTTTLYDDIVPIPGIYTYNVATWNGTVDDSPLSLPFTITVGGIEGTTPNFLNDELIFGAYFGGLLNLVEFTYLPEREPFLASPSPMIINRYLQEPTDNRQRGVDYTFFLVPGETIKTVAVTGISAQGVTQANIVPLVIPLVVSNLLLDPSGLKFAYNVSGGQDGIEYEVQFTTMTQIQTSTVEEIFSIRILVQDQFP